MESLVKRSIEEIRESIESVFRVSTIDPMVYDPLIDLMVESIQGKLGGTQPYIHTPSRAKRNAEIMRMWHQRIPHREIAKKFDLSESAISKIVTAMLAMRKRPKKTGFGSSDWSL